jgi:hypothetical protein
MEKREKITKFHSTKEALSRICRPRHIPSCDEVTFASTFGATFALERPQVVETSGKQNKHGGRGENEHMA